MLYHKPPTALLIREKRREKLFNMGCGFSSDHRVLSWGVDIDQVEDLFAQVVDSALTPRLVGLGFSVSIRLRNSLAFLEPSSDNSPRVVLLRCMWDESKRKYHQENREGVGLPDSEPRPQFPVAAVSSLGLEMRSATKTEIRALGEKISPGRPELLKFIYFYWSTADLQCCANPYRGANYLSRHSAYTQIDILLKYSFLWWFITRYWLEFFKVYDRKALMFIHPICNLYLLIPDGCES